MDGGMKGDHGVGHGLAGGIEVEATVERRRWIAEKAGEPGRVGTCAGGGKATKARVQGVAAEGVDGGFAEHGGTLVLERRLRDGEEAEILAGARRHAPPGGGGGGGLPAEAWAQAGAAEFGADGSASLIAKKEHGIGPGVGVKVAGVEERFQERGGKSALFEEVAPDEEEVFGTGPRKGQGGS